MMKIISVMMITAIAVYTVLFLSALRAKFNHHCTEATAARERLRERESTSRTILSAGCLNRFYFTFFAISHALNLTCASSFRGLEISSIARKGVFPPNSAILNRIEDECSSFSSRNKADSLGDCFDSRKRQIEFSVYYRYCVDRICRHALY